MKFFATLFVAFLAIHASTQSPVQDDSIKNIVVEILSGVLNLTNTVLTDVETQVANFEADEDAETKKIVDALAEIAAESNSALIKDIDLLKDGASDDGVAALECIDAQEENLDAAVKSTISTTADCISKKYSDIFKEVDKVLGQLRDLQDDVQGQTDTLGKCSEGELACLVSFLGTIVATGQKVVVALQTDVPEIISLIQNVVAQIDSCDIAPSIKDNALKIFEDTIACIKKS
ncbi:uncharacterized protein [Euwallacea similis]|uniref:uncharacterized protein n=1 Tax=Euwallacea similis TaxID=1736056 RepID=UPI00344B93A9